MDWKRELGKRGKREDGDEKEKKGGGIRILRGEIGGREKKEYFFFLKKPPPPVFLLSRSPFPAFFGLFLITTPFFL